MHTHTASVAAGIRQGIWAAQATRMDPGILVSVDAALGASRSGAADRFEAARQEFDAQAQRFEEAKSRLQTTADIISKNRPQREMLYHSTFARLQAKLDTMPVVEQAKGILMAQQGCGPDEAFDLLRRASQRANIKVHVLAGLIVARQTSQGSDGDASPHPFTDSVQS